MNENSETIELPVTDSICPPELLSSDRGSGQGCGTGLRDRDTGRIYETMMRIPGPFLVAGHGPGSQCPQEWAKRTGSVSGRRAEINQAD